MRGTRLVRRLVRHRVDLDVPATSANLGAGFDALALALDLGNHVSVEVLPDRPPGYLEVLIEGEGAGHLPTDERNRFVAMLTLGLREAGAETAHGLRIRMRNAIPLARGLGSSAAATVGGLVAADALLGGGVLSPERILGLAAGAEGHADNAAAALMGGFCVVGPSDGPPLALRLEPPAGLWLALYIPDRPLATSAMRKALPTTVPFAAAIHNVGAAALAVAAMAQGRLEMLAPATRDRLHEPYRAAVYPELPILVGAALDAGALGACLSGAGSSIIAFSDSEAMARAVVAALETAASAAGLGGRSHVGRPRSQGALVEQA